MKTVQSILVDVVATPVLLGLMACSDMTTREKDSAAVDLCAFF